MLAFEQINDDAASRSAQPPVIEQLVQQLRETADKLLRDGATRADVKLLNTALKELRYSFKVFTPYRTVRKVTVFGSARLPADNATYQQAVEFGKRIAQAGWMVITGAASGIMEEPAWSAPAVKNISVNILPVRAGSQSDPHPRRPQVDEPEILLHAQLLFVKEADAFAMFPGGFGTQDECFEVMTLVQTGKAQIFPIVMIRTNRAATTGRAGATTSTTRC